MQKLLTFHEKLNFACFHYLLASSGRALLASGGRALLVSGTLGLLASGGTLGCWAAGPCPLGARDKGGAPAGWGPAPWGLLVCRLTGGACLSPLAVTALRGLSLQGNYSQSKSSVHDKLHELHSHFPPIAQRTPSIITSSCWKSTVMASSIDRKKGHVQNVTFLLAKTIRNLYDYQTKEYVDMLTSQSSSLTGQTNLWRSEHVSFSINTGWPDVTNGTFSTTYSDYKHS